jgi:broad specificity phosphatase PhoE
MARLFLIRHGESEWNAERRLQGHADPPLSVRGREQVRQLAGMLKGRPMARVITSDLTRARQTAELLGYRAEPDAGWREIQVGIWTGRNIDELRSKQGGEYRDWRAGRFTPPEGESWDAFGRRIGDALTALAEEAGDVMVVCHGGVVRAAVWMLLGIEPGFLSPVSPASLTIVDTRPAPRLRAYGLKPELGDLDAPD